MGHNISDESFQRLGANFLSNNLNLLADGRMFDRFGHACFYLLNHANMEDLLLWKIE